MRQGETVQPGQSKLQVTKTQKLVREPCLLCTKLQSLFHLHKWVGVQVRFVHLIFMRMQQSWSILPAQDVDFYLSWHSQFRALSQRISVSATVPCNITFFFCLYLHPLKCLFLRPVPLLQRDPADGDCGGVV